MRFSKFRSRDQRTHAAAVEGKLRATEMIRAPHTDVEALCDAQGKEWARLMLEEHLALRASVEKRVEVTGVDGVERRSSRDSERHLETVVGTVVVPRAAYQAPGCEDLHPMDATLNLPRELFSFGVRRMVAREVARASFEEVVEIVHDYGGATIAKRQVEELAVRAAQDFDAFYEQREPAHAPAEDLLVLSTRCCTGLSLSEKSRTQRDLQTIYPRRALRGLGGGSGYRESCWSTFPQGGP